MKLTVPARIGLGPALAFLEASRPWLVAEVGERLPMPRPFRPGDTLFVAGEALTLERQARGASRRAGGRLLASGEGNLFNAAVLRWLRVEARRVIADDVREFAARAGVAIGGLRIADPASRWGSCSSAGRLSFSFRLVLAPTDVRRAVVAHEVAHRIHFHHGPAFHAAADALFGAPSAPALAWLRRNGPALHALGA